MGVYIKNITKDDLAENGALMWGKRIIFIPPEDIIPVQDHGDLIDRDEAVKRMTEWFRRLYKKYGEYDDYVLGFSAALYFIDEYKAVIHAERSEASLCDNCDQRNDKGCCVCKYINERSEE